MSVEHSDENHTGLTKWLQYYCGQHCI